MRALLGQVARFAAVGGSAAAVDYGILWLGMAAGLSPALARVPAVGVAVVYTWWLNRHFTFASGTPPTWAEFARYVSVAFAGILLNLGIYWGGLWLGLPVWLAFCLGVGITAVYSFWRYRILLHRGD